MNDYFVYIICLTVSVVFASLSAYDSERMKSSRFVLGVILLAGLILPLLNSLKDFNLSDFEFEKMPEYNSQLSQEATEKAFSRGIKLALIDEFSLKGEGIEVTTSGFDLENVRADTVHIKLYGKNVFADIPSIRSYVEKEGFGECIVEVNFE